MDYTIIEDKDNAGRTIYKCELAPGFTIESLSKEELEKTLEEVRLDHGQGD